MVPWLILSSLDWPEAEHPHWPREEDELDPARVDVWFLDRPPSAARERSETRRTAEESGNESEGAAGPRPVDDGHAELRSGGRAQRSEW